MKRWNFGVFLLIGLILAFGMAIARPYVPPAWSQTISQATAPKPAASTTVAMGGADGTSGTMAFSSITQQTEELPGLFTLYYGKDSGKLYLALQPDQLNQNYLSVMTLSSGLGEIFYRGWPLGDFLFQFRRVQDTVQLVVPNIYFRTRPGDPQQRSIERSFSDSTLASMPIVSTRPEDGALLVELNQLLVEGHDLSDLSSVITAIFGGTYAMSADTSYINEVQAFPDNVEIDVVYNFSGTNLPFFLTSLPDPRAFNLDVHYSLSALPSTSSYRPRMADERIGYFIDAYQDLSNMSQGDPFVRYIWRWNLEKQHPDAPLSPPKEPIVFWIENTVPEEYRDAIREGALLWNRAFEKAGFENAIEVRQMPDDADWNPADVQYNTIRWTSSLYSFGALGVPRVNPLTGQILDADVVIDAGSVRLMRDTSGFLAQQQSTLGANAMSLLNPQLCNPQVGRPYLQWMEQQAIATLGATGGANGGAAAPQRLDANQRWQAIANQMMIGNEACYGMGLASQGAMGSLALTTLQNILPSGEAMQEFTRQFLVHLTAHEVGHALGLRHNFRASTMLAPEELNDSTLTRDRGLVGSVMDYSPINLAPVGTEQGDYFSVALGPYDEWAIAYGYTPINGTLPIQERDALQAIARQSPTPELAYATDEDAFDFLNPKVNLWDLSNNPLRYAQWQMDNAQAIWEKLPNRYPLPGESYSELRDRFDVVLNYYFEQVFQTARYVGGQVFNRDRRGDPGGRQPFEPVPLEQQREALDVLNRYVFSSDAFNFRPELVSRLAPSRWWHWGSSPAVLRLDYPVYDAISWMQGFTLTSLLSSDRLSRMRDAELSYSPDAILSLPELFDTLQQQVWSEVLNPADAVEISSIRRGLQRQYLQILGNMALRNSSAMQEATNFMDLVIAFETMNAPEDARTLARYHLRQLQEAISSTLRRHDDDMDTLTLAHLEEAQDRITKLIDAPFRGR